MEEVEGMNARKWIGLAIMVAATIMAFLSQYLPWHIYRNIYSLGGYDYYVVVFYQTSLIPAFPMFSIITYLPLIGAFIGLVGCLLCLFPFTLKLAKWLGKISAIILILGYVLFPLLYHLIGFMFSILGLSLVDIFIPSLIGGYLCIISGIVIFTGSVVTPKSEMVAQVVEEGGKKVKKVVKKSEKQVKMVKCVSCGQLIKETDQFCPECGTFQ